MKLRKVAVPVGIEIGSGRILSIDDIDVSSRGLACNLLCPNDKCADQLKANFSRDSNRRNYLSHYKKVATGACEESALHLQGKLVLSRQSTFKTHHYEIVPKSTINDMFDVPHPVQRKVIFGDTPIVFLQPPKLEQTIKDGVEIKGDLVASCKYDALLLEINFEIKVTHAVDEFKLTKIQSLDITTIEIDISHLIGRGVLDDAEVLTALMAPQNHSVLHVSKSLVSVYKSQIDALSQDKIHRVNEKIKAWINDMGNMLIENKFKLPQYSYNLIKIPPHIDKQSLQLNFSKPKLPLDVNVQSLIHNTVNTLKMTIHVGLAIEVLPVIVRRNDDDIEATRLLGKSFLFIDLKAFEYPPVKSSIRWGFNVKAEQYQKDYNFHIDTLIATANAALQEEQNRKVDHVLAIENNIEFLKSQLPIDDYFKAKNIVRLEGQAKEILSVLTKLGVAKQTLLALRCPDIDPDKIFGVKPYVWQIRLVYFVIVLKGSLSDISVPVKYLQTCGISVVEPYKSALLKNKIFKETGVALPFKTPYAVVSAYRSRRGGWWDRLAKFTPK